MVTYCLHIGRAYIVRHGRRNDECGAIEEIKPVNDNEQYSSRYQVYSHYDFKLKVYKLLFLLLLTLHIQTYSILHEPVVVRKVGSHCMVHAF